MRVAFVAVALALALPASALARPVAIATPAGTAREAAIVLARQAGVSIVIADPKVAGRTVPAIAGRMSAAEAVRRIARASAGRAVAVGPGAWRIESAPARARAPAPARAPQDSAAGQAAPESIVVVATKRDLRLEDVPASVSLLDGDALIVGGVGGTEKIVQKLATVTSTHLGSGRNKLFIRGIADSSFTGPTQATVGQYLGDLRLNYNAPDPDLRLSDMDRVEVLEGPQGTLYGAGSLGGIIRLVPRAPRQGVVELAGLVGASALQDGRPGYDASLTLNLPVIGETLALRATVDAQSLGGYIDKPALDREDGNRTRILGGRATARAALAPGWTVDATVLAQSTRAADSQYADRYGDPLTSSAKVIEGADADFELGQLVVAGEVGALRIASTTGLVRQTLEERYDATPEGGDPRVFAQHNRTRMLAHETRVWMPERNGFAWVAGASFTHNETVLTRDFVTDIVGSSATGVRNTIDEFTAYGEASFRIRKAFVATAGGRLTWSRLGGAGEDVSPLIALAQSDVTASRTFATFLPSVSLHAEIAPETMIYMRYQQGFRPGGLAIESEFVRQFRNDRTATYEIGARKGRPGIDPYDLALNLSYTSWEDIQADYIDLSGLPSTANIGDGRVWSASLSGGVEAAPGLRVEAGATWNASRVDRAPMILLARSAQIPNIAQIAGRAALSWRREIGADFMLDVDAWASYVGRSRLGIGPQLGELQGDYLDSGLDLRVGRERFGVTFGVHNLTNARGNRFSLGTPFGNGQDQVTPLRPRSIRIGIDHRF